MTASTKFNQGPNILSPDNATWQERVYRADALWAQVDAMLKAEKVEMPQTLRRPDVRLIVNNVSGREIQFYNPGDHSASKPEIIPADGNDTAVMVMVAGPTLQDQHRNANDLFRNYELGQYGLSEKFMSDLRTGYLRNFVSEAYGPAPFDGQAAKLVPVRWQNAQGAAEIEITPVTGPAAAFGARAATQETAFLATFPVSVQGTRTTPERVESDGMIVVVSSDWKTGEVSTRPIVPSVARGFYGSYYEKIPVVTVDGDGQVVQVAIKGREPIVAAAPPAAKKRVPPSRQSRVPG